jgi:hypothetical protein
MLPGLNRKISHTAVRRHTLTVGTSLDERIIEPDEYASLVPPRLPVPASNRLTIAIDGTYVRSDLTNGLYQHYVVAGRIDHDGQEAIHAVVRGGSSPVAPGSMRCPRRSTGKFLS